MVKLAAESWIFFEDAFLPEKEKYISWNRPRLGINLSFPYYFQLQLEETKIWILFLNNPYPPHRLEKRKKEKCIIWDQIDSGVIFLPFTISSSNWKKNQQQNLSSSEQIKILTETDWSFFFLLVIDCKRSRKHLEIQISILNRKIY